MQIQIDKFIIGAGRTFVIAEIGNNHNGCIERAIQMVERARQSGADCVKFQMRHLGEIYRQRSLAKRGDDLGTEYVIDLLKRFELSVGEHRRIAEYCTGIGLLYLCTPWDQLSVEILDSFGVPAYKIASADLTNLPLLERMSEIGKPLILSTGMNTVDEVKTTVEFLNKRNTKYVLLHCNSTYPAPFHDINLKWISAMRKLHPLVGYSGHERGTNISIAAVALDACVIERHFTLDRNMEGPDHAASLLPNEFARMVDGIREIEQGLGDGKNRILSQGEMMNRENLGKSLVAARSLKLGTVIRKEYIKVRSPGQGLSPQMYEELIGKKIHRDIAEEDFFFQTDLFGTRTKPRNYKFNLPWGIPVRYHDYREYADRIKPNLWEFHLSYSDMDLKPSDYIDVNNDSRFIVHAPELFSNSRLMDLASPNSEYRKASIDETQKVVNITRELKCLFPNSSRPCIVANIGGFTMDGALPNTQINRYYERFASSLQELDLEGVELIPQTMAPFPWHFGGQRYQNLFWKIDEIVEWCKKLNIRMCFDISHSRLACNYLGVDFYKFAEVIAPLTAHLHLGDALGINGEGLQIGDGDLDFSKLGTILKQGCPTASFIPEIWQGHKDGGEGFWIALDRLEGSL